MRGRELIEIRRVFWIRKKEEGLGGGSGEIIKKEKRNIILIKKSVYNRQINVGVL